MTVNGVASNSVSFIVTAPGSLPPPWASQDVGNPAVAGQATFTAGTFSVSGAGADIWDTNDQFRFVYQAIDGDAEIVARVPTQQNTDAWAKAGVMIREDFAGNAPNVLATITAGNGISFQQRATRDSVTGLTLAGTTARWSAWCAAATP